MLVATECDDRTEHREPVIAERAHAPTPGAGWDPSHPETIIAWGDAHAKGFERSCHGFDPVRFLYAQLGGSADDRFAPRERGR